MSDKESTPDYDELLKLSGTLIHEIRSQLFCLGINATSLQIYMPDLLAAYTQAKAAGLDLPAIADDHFDVLQNAATHISDQLLELNHILNSFHASIRPSDKQSPGDYEENHNTGTQPREVQTSTLRILLVEDEEIHQDIAQSVLGSANYNCDIAHNGVDALEKFSRNDYDLVLMDMHMPEMDGMQVASQIRNMTCERRHTPIIGLSNIEPLDGAMFFSAGFNKFMLKPLKLDVFEQTLLQLLNPHRKT
ncbi:MAG: response regulator [Gammaproteobacteria bacterium]|nr:response regulator [Gammaproteobacteria bacterium]